MGNPLAVQWSGLSAFTAVSPVQFLFREPRSHKPRSMVKKKKRERNEIKTKTLLNGLEFKHLKLVGNVTIECYSYNPQNLIAV